MDNKTLLLILMIVLITFVVLLAVLGIVFIIALRKRRPVVKVVMAPLAQQQAKAEAEAEAAAEASAESSEQPKGEEGAEAPAPIPEPEPEPEEEEGDEESTIVTEGSESVRYDRSFTAKICQLGNDTKEWYSDIKNDLLSYEKVKARMSWKRESFRIGRMTVARLAVRGKTLCLLLSVEPDGYSGTKYSVEDVSNMANTVDTPTLYRIKSVRRLKYAKEMIAGMMKEYQSYKDPRYEAHDYFIPYEGDMSLMQRGLLKRVVSGSTRAFKIEEVDPFAQNGMAETGDQADGKDEENV